MNNVRPVQIPLRVLDAAGHNLTSTGVRYKWAAGAPVSVSASGVITCTHDGDASVRASLGPLATTALVRCRRVHNVRAMRMLNLVVGDPAQNVDFEAEDADGRPVTLLTGEVTVLDSSVATLDGLSIRARAAGSTGLTMRVGDRLAFASVHSYERVRTPEGIRPGQHVAVPLRLAGGEMRRWRLAASAEDYYLAMLPYTPGQPMLRLIVEGAICEPALGAHSFFCLAQHGATVTVYHPQNVDPGAELSGTLAVWRQGWQ